MNHPALNVPTAWHGAATEYVQKIRWTIPDFNPKVIVEIGVDYGYSFFHLALTFPEADVVGVDDYSHHGDADLAKAHVQKHLPSFSNASLIIGDSKTLSEFFDKKIDLLHIDGDHSYNGVKNDFENWSKHLNDGAVVMFHDIRSHSNDVGRFFNELDCGKKVEADTNGAGLGILFYKAEEKVSTNESRTSRLLDEKFVIGKAGYLKSQLLSRAKRIEENLMKIGKYDAGITRDLKPEVVETLRRLVVIDSENQRHDSVAFATLRWVLRLTQDIEPENLQLEL